MDRDINKPNTLFWILYFITAILFFLIMISLARADTINIEKLATAIYYAENSKTHPYGILAHYKHTTPRQACINTIKSAIRKYEKSNKRLDYITFLSKTYAPVGVANDPKGLNKNWVKNVKYFLIKIK